jgi:hypothetical protein
MIENHDWLFHLTDCYVAFAYAVSPVSALGASP